MMTRGTVGALLAYVVAIPVHAATITVTNTNDSGPGSLRQALADANRGDTITFAVTGTIELTSAELVIDKPITISGPGSNLLAVSRTSNTPFRIFHVMRPSRTVNIEGLTMSGGYAQFDYGGGILTDHAALTVTNCSVVGNIASAGGGIYSDGATLAIVGSTIIGNGAGGSFAAGGGIYSTATLTIINSTINDNSAIGDFEVSGSGGGIAGGGTIINSTIAGNHAALSGGRYRRWGYNHELYNQEQFGWRWPE